MAARQHSGNCATKCTAPNADTCKCPHIIPTQLRLGHPRLGCAHIPLGLATARGHSALQLNAAMRASNPEQLQGTLPGTGRLTSTR